jgi:hypothetical protein
MNLRDLPPLSVSFLGVLCASTVAHAEPFVCKDGGGGGCLTAAYTRRLPSDLCR